ncbi:hypothetical protein [Streptomyces sp. NPDC050738]|uniref:hypothetical protein n=1 Tax=Streptomyces sp. NPDC050738 TaxID=3154744 RepID=UPI0034222DD8
MNATRARQAALLLMSAALCCLSLLALAFAILPLVAAFFACAVVCAETAWHLSDTAKRAREDARTISRLVSELAETDAAISLNSACCVPWFLTSGQQHAVHCHTQEP